MIPQYQFNLNGADPLLTTYNQNPSNYAAELEAKIAQMQQLKEQLENRVIPNQNIPRQRILFDEINTEVSALTKQQKEILFNDKEYAENEYAIQSLIQEELINLVKFKLQSTEKGKQLLEKQLNLVKAKKESIVKESDKELDIFKKFQIASQANPNLSYAEFVKSINQ